MSTRADGLPPAADIAAHLATLQWADEDRDAERLCARVALAVATANKRTIGETDPFAAVEIDELLTAINSAPTGSTALAAALTANVGALAARFDPSRVAAANAALASNAGLDRTATDDEVLGRSFQMYDLAELEWLDAPEKTPDWLERVREQPYLGPLADSAWEWLSTTRRDACPSSIGVGLLHAAFLAIEGRLEEAAGVVDRVARIGALIDPLLEAIILFDEVALWARLDRDAPQCDALERALQAVKVAGVSDATSSTFGELAALRYAFVAEVHWEHGRYELAGARAERAAALFSAALGPDDPQQQVAEFRWGAALWSADRVEEAIPLLARGARTLESIGGLWSPVTRECHLILADSLDRVGEHERALATASRLLPHVSAADEPETYADIVHRVAHYESRCGRALASRATLTQGFAALHHAHADDHPVVERLRSILVDLGITTDEAAQPPD